MIFQCRECFSYNIHRSRFRLKDVGRLLLCHYPIRCLRCNRRDYVSLLRLFQRNRNVAGDSMMSGKSIDLV